jgi:peptidoglycan/LPS O-acetylase OafA/YrhL
VTTTGAPARDRLTGADGMRALAALWVVMSHLFQRLSPDQAPWLREVQLVMMKGPFGVSIFFVLSGMLLATPFWRAWLTGRPRPGFGRYARRRVARILPGFYASLAVSTVVSLLVVPDAPYRLVRLLAGLTFTTGFHWVTFFPVPMNGPLWSIGFEVVSYVLLALAMWGMFRLPRRGVRVAAAYWAAVVVVVVAANQLITTRLVPGPEQRGWQWGDLGGAKEWMPSYNPVGFFAHFCFGVAAAAVVVWWQVRRAGRRHAAFDALGAAAIVGAAALVWVNREPYEPGYLDNFQGQPYLFPWFALLVAVALVGLAQSRVLGRLWDHRFARFTARVSFGIYVWHYLLIEWLAHRTGWFVYFGVEDAWTHLAVSAGLLVVTYAVAAASWRWIERPALQSRWADRAG